MMWSACEATASASTCSVRSTQSTALTPGLQERSLQICVRVDGQTPARLVDGPGIQARGLRPKCQAARWHAVRARGMGLEG